MQVASIINFRNLHATFPVFGQKKKLDSYPVNSHCDTFEYTNINNNSYTDFRKQFKSVYGNVPVEKIVDDIINNPKNLIGEGAQKRVYCIPGIDDYLIGKYKKVESEPGAYFVRAKNTLPEYNFGQPVATNNADLIIMKKVDGKPHSIPLNVAPFCRRFEGIECTYEEALTLLKSIEEIEKFPLEAYIDFAKQIKYISDNNLRVDTVSANNLLVDKKNKSLHYIDIPDNQDVTESINPKCGTMDMICLCLNSMLFGSCLKALNEDEANTMIEKSKKIIEKCKIAGKVTGLELGTENTRKTYDLIAKSKPDPLHKRQHVRFFEEMLAPFNDIAEHY